jgi:hypothetical protein
MKPDQIAGMSLALGEPLPGPSSGVVVAVAVVGGGGAGGKAR